MHVRSVPRATRSRGSRCSCPRSRRGALVALALATSAFSTLHFADSALAASRTWLNASGGNYDTTGNWSGGVVPGALDNTVFNLNGPYTVNFTTPRQIRDVAIVGDNVNWNLGATSYTVTAATPTALAVAPGATDVSALTISNGSLLATSSTIGATAGGRGTLSMGFGYASFSNSLNVGSNGAGTLTMGTGALIDTQSLNIGANATGVGTVRLQGFGALLTVSGTNSCVIGNAGAGSLHLQSLMNTNGVIVGSATAGSGAINITDGAGLSNSGTIVLGKSGVGTLDVNASLMSTHFLTLGEQLGARGVLRLTNNAIVTCANDFVVGALGTGTVTIDAASVMNTGNTIIGGNTGGRGEVNVSGGNTQLTASGQLYLGAGIGAVGTLNITNGAAVANTGAAQIATYDGSTAAIRITGAGSRWISNGATQIGGGGFSLGSATVFIGPGASMIVSGTNALSVASTGAITLDGGTLSVGAFNNSGVFNFNSGTVTFTGTPLSIASGGALGATIDLSAGKTIISDTGVQIAQDGLLRMSGGNLTTALVTNAGEILLDHPSSNLAAAVTNTGLVRGDGRVSGALINQSGGEVRVSNGDRIAFSNAIGNNTNAGNINLFGGVVEFDQTLVNTGRITGRGSLIAHGAISNAGTITFSASTSDVIGALTNTGSGAKTIVTGGSVSTFFDDVTNVAGSEFRVSTASTAVFLGNVTGLGAFTGPGTKDFEGNASGLMINTQIGTTIVGPGATLTASFIRDAALHVEGTATIAPSGASANVSRIATLDVSGTLDMNDNDVIATNTPRAVIQSLIAQARNGGAWDEPGITSTSARNATPRNTTLGVLSGAEYRSIFGPAASFDAFAVEPTDVLVKYTCYGDTDLNGTVNFDDYARIDGGFNNGRTGWLNGDLDYSGGVNFDDYALIDLAFNTQTGPFVRAVPEPAAVLSPLGVLLARRGRRARAF